MITVYTKFGCSTCDATKLYLARHKVDFLEVNMDLDSAARAFVERLGYAAAPVVVAGAEHFSGFRPDRLLALSCATDDIDSAVID